MVSIILICGGTCSGKSLFASWFSQATVLSLDNFYKPHSEVARDSDGQPDYDVPESFDLSLCKQVVEGLVAGKTVEVPQYDFKISDRVGMSQLTLRPDAKFLVVEGLFSLMSPLRELGTMNIFLDTPTEVRVARRLMRDVVRKGRGKVDTLQVIAKVEQRYIDHIEPLKQYADMIIPFSSNPLGFF